MRNERAIRSSCLYYRRMAARCGEHFDVSPSEWVAVWRAHPLRAQQGHIARINTNEPWTRSNLVFRPGVTPRKTHSYQPPSDARVLTVKQWVRELRAQA